MKNGSETHAIQIHGQAVAFDFYRIPLRVVVGRKLLTAVVTNVTLYAASEAVFWEVFCLAGRAFHTFIMRRQFIMQFA